MQITDLLFCCPWRSCNEEDDDEAYQAIGDPDRDNGKQNETANQIANTSSSDPNHSDRVPVLANDPSKNEEV